MVLYDPEVVRVHQGMQVESRPDVMKLLVQSSQMPGQVPIVSS
uniref:Uncharacterized protein n=1 Tax=Arundo donax TaxID=35708 RepID=A0A0A9CSN6_ARUDO